MELQQILSRFSREKSALDNAFTQGVQLTEIQDHDLRVQHTLNDIKEFRPRNIQELRSKLEFFIHQAIDEQNERDVSFALNSLVSIVQADFSFTMDKILGDTKSEARVQIDPNKKIGISKTYDIVTNSFDRLSIIDTNFRYVNTSQRNSHFYKLKPSDLVGAHVGEMIGEARFEQRAKRFFENTFSGKAQEYFHTLETEDGTRVINCQMVPLRGDEDNIFGSMVAINDITDLITDQNSVILEGLG